MVQKQKYDISVTTAMCFSSAKIQKLFRNQNQFSTSDAAMYQCMIFAQWFIPDPEHAREALFLFVGKKRGQVSGNLIAPHDWVRHLVLHTGNFISQAQTSFKAPKCVSYDVRNLHTRLSGPWKSLPVCLFGVVSISLRAICVKGVTEPAWLRWVCRGE